MKHKYFISYNLMNKNDVVARCYGILEANQEILTSEDLNKMIEQLADKSRDSSTNFDFVHILSLNYLGKEE